MLLILQGCFGVDFTGFCFSSTPLLPYTYECISTCVTSRHKRMRGIGDLSIYTPPPHCFRLTRSSTEKVHVLSLICHPLAILSVLSKRDKDKKPGFSRHSIILIRRALKEFAFPLYNCTTPPYFCFVHCTSHKVCFFCLLSHYVHLCRRPTSANFSFFFLSSSIE